MKIAVIGTGYVGLVTGTCLAESGNEVVCIDVDVQKIENLRNDILPIFEPGLEEIVKRNRLAGRLVFSTDLAEGICDCPVIIIGVGTPQSDSGEADLTAIWTVVEEIARHASEPKIVVIKSTVPVGTNAKAAAILSNSPFEHQMASNPEFLKEGYAVDDFMKPDRIVVGVNSSEVAAVLYNIHAPFLRSGRPFLVMTPESAEMTKYASNCMLATKISFINEIANLCEAFGADINDVRQGMGHDERIGFQFLHPGAGFGGSCFPKDVNAMAAMARARGLPADILHTVDRVNNAQKSLIFKKLATILAADHSGEQSLHGKQIAVWGLAFKPRTDDVREAPSLVLIDNLLAGGAKVRVYDPEAMDNIKAIFGDKLTYCPQPYEAIKDVDALAIITEWQEFHNPNFKLMHELMGCPIIVDGRNLYDTEQMERLGFVYASIGRRTVVGAAGSEGERMKIRADKVA